jgi:hypothetical protein
MSILSEQPTQELPRLAWPQPAVEMRPLLRYGDVAPHCRLSWCENHYDEDNHDVPEDRAVFHSGQRRTMLVGQFRNEISVHGCGIEDETPVLYIDGCSDVALSPAEALRFAAMLADYARRVGGVR